MSEVGTGYIIQVNVENVKNIPIRELEFSCEFYVCDFRKVVFRKAEMVHVQKKSGDLYFALLDSAKIGPGPLQCRIVIQDPVALWSGGHRPVVIRKFTGKIIGHTDCSHPYYPSQQCCDYDEGYRVTFSFETGLPKPDVGYIFYGHIIDQISDFSKITSSMLMDPQNHILSAEAGKMGKTSCGQMVPGNKVVVLIPEDTAYVATKDNGIGGRMAFDQSIMGANGGTTVVIDNVTYRVYGEMMTASGELFVYVD